jgi:tetratricopeptide (TPR) repeat protein
MEWGIADSGLIPEIEKTLPKHNSLIECLGALGISSGNHLENFFGSRIRESVYEIFKWEKGDCRFIDEDLDRRREVIVRLNTENLILEGARRIDEWSNIKNKVPSRHSVFVLCKGNEESQALNLKPREWEILSLIDGQRSVNEINDKVGEDLFTSSKLIYGLVVMGVIELVNDDIDPEVGAGNEERIEELLRKGRSHYSRFNLEKAAADFEKALQIDQDNFEALRMLGELYYKMDRLSEALVYLRKAREMRPNNQKTIFIKGYLHARLGEVEQAIAEWEELREKTENSKIIELVKRRINVAREWEKVLQEY